MTNVNQSNEKTNGLIYEQHNEDDEPRKNIYKNTTNIQYIQ